jgi:hypothetical protein
MTKPRYCTLAAPSSFVLRHSSHVDLALLRELGLEVESTNREEAAVFTRKEPITCA